jgi:hypothetical protein
MGGISTAHKKDHKLVSKANHGRKETLLRPRRVMLLQWFSKQWDVTTQTGITWFGLSTGVGCFIEPYDFYEGSRLTKQRLDT